VHDFAALEGRGVIAAFLASTEFVEAADAQARALGYREVPSVFVPHPIQDRTDAEMRALAEAAFAEVLAAVTRSRGAG
jgi:alkanesulfonate monooxygenase SsuD/methylene tetrahydromethanopterin reductase-like flavin-dependent oxidoreductase (luciferase family)